MATKAITGTTSEEFLPGASLANIKAAGGCMTVQVGGHTLALFAVGGKVYAVDNRCPHMGFPLHRGTVKDGILTCHWHHARFDLESGGTFDEWADDVRTFPTEVRDGQVWVNVGVSFDLRAHHSRRLRDGLERDIPLVIGKAVIALLDAGEDPVAPFRIALDFGARYRQPGWGAGLTTLTCLMNLLPSLAAEDRPRALYHGLSAVARDCAGEPPRFGLRPLPALSAGPDLLKRWFRQFVEVRDAEGAERCVVSAVRAGAGHRQMADMLFAAATDHRYIQVGHVADFTNKALEALDLAGWEYAEPVLASLVSGYTRADRMEESNSWRHPVDLVAILEDSFEQLPEALATGHNKRETKRATNREEWAGRDQLIPVLLGEDPQAIAAALIEALREGATEEQLAESVAYAALLRIARFHTTNEFGDWDTALHTLTFSNAIHQGLRRSPSVELLRGVFDAAMSVYRDRFLNIPPAPLLQPDGPVENPETLLKQLPELLDRQQAVEETAELVGKYLYGGGDPAALRAVLGGLLLREDRDFHTIQTLEAAFRQHANLRGSQAGAHALIAASRYLAAHSPTVRAQGQTFQIAHRLQRGERLFEEP